MVLGLLGWVFARVVIAARVPDIGRAWACTGLKDGLEKRTACSPFGVRADAPRWLHRSRREGLPCRVGWRKQTECARVGLVYSRRKHGQAVSQRKRTERDGPNNQSHIQPITLAIEVKPLPRRTLQLRRQAFDDSRRRRQALISMQFRRLHCHYPGAASRKNGGRSQPGTIEDEQASSNPQRKYRCAGG